MELKAEPDSRGTSPAMTLFELVFTEFRREKPSTGQPRDKHGHDET